MYTLRAGKSNANTELRGLFLEAIGQRQKAILSVSMPPCISKPEVRNLQSSGYMWTLGYFQNIPTLVPAPSIIILVPLAFESASLYQIFTKGIKWSLTRKSSHASGLSNTRPGDQIPLMSYLAGQLPSQGWNILVFSSHSPWHLREFHSWSSDAHPYISCF